MIINNLVLGLALLTMLGAVYLQWLTWFRMKPTRMVGDEAEYAARGCSEDPYRPRQFLRVPLMPWISRRACAFRDQKVALRGCLALATLLTFFLTIISGWFICGSRGALVAGLVLLFMPERLFMGNHFWPDAVLALWLSGIQLVLILGSDPLIAAALCGVLIMLASLTRLEQLVLIPGVLMALALSSGSPTPNVVLIVCTPTLVAYAIWMLRCRRTYATWLPDNTWCFNLRIMSDEIQNEGGQASGIQDRVESYSPVWESGHRISTRKCLTELARNLSRRPLAFLWQILVRAISLIGPDTFVTERLLPPRGDAYANLRPAIIKPIRLWLRMAVPLVFAFAVVANGFLGQRPPAYLLPAVFLFMAFGAVHARTRYRVTLFPALAIWAAWLAGQELPAVDLRMLLALLAACIFTLALTLVVVRREFDSPRAIDAQGNRA